MPAKGFDYEQLLVWAFLSAGVVLLVLAVVRLKLPGRKVEPQCQRCGYATAGLPQTQERCPECGRTLNQSDWAYSADWKTGWLRYGPGPLGSSGIFLLVLGMVWAGILKPVLGIQGFWVIAIWLGVSLMYRLDEKALKKWTDVFNQKADL